MIYKIAGKTDVGVARNNNEDSLISFECPLGQVVAVCDGMGGENGGETASNLAVSIIQDILENQTFNSPEDGIVSACMAANQGILYRASQYPELAGMGSTCVIAIINGNMIYYGSVGDSRIYYYLPNKGFRQLTKDQSYVQTLVDAGQITKEEAENHPQKNEITNALGYEAMQPPVVESITAVPGARLLLCSDGLSGMVPDTSLLHVIKREDWSIEEKVEKLIHLANEAGGLDNITVQLVEWTNKGKANASTTPQNNSATKSNNTANIIIAIACMVLLSCGGYIGWKMFHKDHETVTVDKTQSNRKSTAPKQTQVEKQIIVEKKTAIENQITVQKKTVVDKKTPEKSPNNNAIKKASDKGTPKPNIIHDSPGKKNEVKPEIKPVKSEPKPVENEIVINPDEK